jgi:Glycosyltransferase family 87
MRVTRRIAIRWAWTTTGIAGVLRFLVATYQAISFNHGDFYATLPGAYAQTLNPTLWNSPDLVDSWAYHRAIYLYGPTQYLTLYPIVFLDSYQRIASVLLGLYGVLLFIAMYLLWRTLREGEDRRTLPFAQVVGVTLFFTPVLQAFGQREFEVVVFLVITLATTYLIRGRSMVAGALLGYATWFKLWPAAFAGYLLLKRRSGAVLAYVAASIAVLVLAQVVFGLGQFEMLASSQPLGSVFGPALAGPATFYWSGQTPLGSGFCSEWSANDATQVSVRTVLCRVGFNIPQFPVRLAFVALWVVAAVAFLIPFLKLEGLQTATQEQKKWRTLFEMSLVVFGGAVLLHANYYYLIFAAIPLNVLVARFLSFGAGPMKWVTLAVTYWLLAAFVVPISLVTRVIGTDAWTLYMRYAVYFYGELLLFGLLFYEYAQMARRVDDRNPLDGHSA